MHRILAILALLMAFAAGEARAGDVMAMDAWARASAGMAKAGAAFLILHNRGAKADRLTAVETPVSEKAELHTHVQEGEVMKMREVPAIDVPAGGQVTFQPGGFHIMLIGLKQPLEEGTSFPIKLKFEQAGEITVDVAVKKAGAMGSMDHPQPMQHSH